MLKVKKIDHVAICVRDVGDASRVYGRLFGVEAGEREHVASQGVDVMLLPVGATCLELVAPHGSESVARFLEKRGSSLHHIAFEVDRIEQALHQLKDLGVPLIDQEPREGAGGRKVAFLHPKATGGVLVELVGAADGREIGPNSGIAPTAASRAVEPRRPSRRRKRR